MQCEIGRMEINYTFYFFVFLRTYTEMLEGCFSNPDMAQATAGAVLAFRTRDKKTKQVAVSGSITAYMGITEPILYGVSLPKKYPLIATMIGGACGGLYAGLTHTHRFATGSSGLPAVLLYMGDNTATCFINIIIAIAISALVSGVLTFLFSLKFEKDNEIKDESENKSVAVDGKIDVVSPLAGEVIPLSSLEREYSPDERIRT